MDKYLIGFSNQIMGFESLDIIDEKISNLKNELVVMLLDDKSNGRLYDYYSKTRELLVNNNKIILILDGATSRIRKQIGMLLVSYRNYNIYTIDDISSIDSSYISALNEREPSEEEVITFVGADLTAYAQINELMLKMVQSIEESDVEGLRSLIESNRESIEGFVDIIDYMKRVVDTVNSGDTDNKIKELRNKISELEKREIESNKKLRDAEGKLEEAKEDASTIRREAFQAKKRVGELEEQLNSREPVIRAYSELQTQMIRCKAKIVIYFKEISPISYMPSMITKMIEVMQKVDKLRVKLMIYDNKNSFLAAYKPLPVVGSGEYVSNRDIVVNKYDKMVVVEANQALIEDVLQSDWDVVIVYDRLKQSKDIVSGNNVYKYWVLNSITEFKALSQSFKIDKTRIITRPGVLPESITIKELPDYKTKTQSAKLAEYINMQNMGENRGRVFDIIFRETNVKSIR